MPPAIQQRGTAIDGCFIRTNTAKLAQVYRIHFRFYVALVEVVTQTVDKACLLPYCEKPPLVPRKLVL